MSMEWWRCKHGAPFDPKWRAVAVRAQSRPGDVWAVFTTLCDRASQAHDRGSLEGLDVEDVAAGLGYELEEVERIIVALKAKALVTDERVATWEKHQPKREDSSTERVRAHRNALKRDEAQKLPREEKTREDTDSEKKPESAREARPSLKTEPIPKQSVSKREHWPEGGIVPEPWLRGAEAERRRLGLPPVDMAVVGVKFANFHIAKANQPRTQTEWQAAFNNFALDEKIGKSNGSPGQHGGVSLATKIWGGGYAQARAEREGSG